VAQYLFFSDESDEALVQSFGGYEWLKDAII
jgi:hypothetical protein